MRWFSVNLVIVEARHVAMLEMLPAMWGGCRAGTQPNAIASFGRVHHVGRRLSCP
jgi:hypothetical protein